MWVPDAAHEALRDLVRAREAAKKDQLRAKHRLGKFLLRHGRRPPTGVKPWTRNYLAWVKHEVHFEQMAQEATLLDYLHEVEHAEARMARLNPAIEEAVKLTPPKMRAVIEALQALRGVAQVAAVTIVAEVGEVSRFSRTRQLMGYGGITASEHSSGGSNWNLSTNPGPAMCGPGCPLADKPETSLLALLWHGRDDEPLRLRDFSPCAADAACTLACDATCLARNPTPCAARPARNPSCNASRLAGRPSRLSFRLSH